LVDPENTSAATRYRDVGLTSALGFNSAAVAGNILWASHSEAGVVAWQLDAPDQPLRTIRQPAKNLVAVDSRRVIYSAGAEVIVASDESETASVRLRAATTVV